MKISIVDQVPSKLWGSLICLWAILWGCVVTVRPLLPIDETRCITVAWEMWQSGNLLVPHLNGLPYSHKPPLLFWLILSGWKLFGVNEWWPRLLPPLFGLGCLFLTSIFARKLWPDKEEIAFAASHILLGCVLWTLFTTVLMYDMLVVFFVLLSLLCLYNLANKKSPVLYSMALGVSLGLGILSKGPVVLLPFAMVTVAAPWWRKKSSIGDHFKFYAGVVSALVMATAISLAWALPAAQNGGPEYAGAILWGQTASRVVGSFAHQRPWWWYIPLLPAILFPWTTTPLLWRNIGKLDLGDLGIRFCLSWLLLPLVVFSLISGKQVYYLLSLFPAFALLVARVIGGASIRRYDLMPLAVFLVIVGLLMIAIPGISGAIPLPIPPWVHDISPLYGVMVILFGLITGWLPFGTAKNLVWSSVICMVLTTGIIHAAVFSQASPDFDNRPIALFLKQMENKGYPLVHVNTYYGEYHFMGRLEKPIEVIKYIDQAPSWLEKHPQGRVLAYFSEWPTPVPPGLNPEYIRPYRGEYVVIFKKIQDK